MRALSLNLKRREEGNKIERKRWGQHTTPSWEINVFR